MGRSIASGVLAGLLAGACGSANVFLCEDDDQCVINHANGVCQVNGYCSFPDPACAETGQRYGDLAGGDLAGTCVEPDVATSTGSVADDGVSLDGIDDADDDASPSSGSLPVDGGPPDDGPPSTDDTTTPSATTTGPVSEDGSTTDGPVTVATCFGERDDSDVTGVTRDTFLTENMATYNYGGHVDLHLNEAGIGVVTLMAFDLSSIAPSTEVAGATLEVWTMDEGALDTGYAAIHRLLEPWTEGTADFGDGIANWTLRERGVEWSIAGAGPGAHDVTELAQLVPDTPSSEFTADLPAAIVQQWVDDPANNHGMLIQGVDSTSYAWIVSSEHGEAGWRPQLCVDLVMPRG